MQTRNVRMINNLPGNKLRKLATSGLLILCLVAAAMVVGEGQAHALSWTKYTSTGQPTLTGTRARGTASTPTLIPLAINYYAGTLEYIWVLTTTTTGCISGNYQLYVEAFGTWSQEKDGSGNPVCLRGVVADGANSGLAFGWKENGNIWDNVGGTWHHQSALDGYTSIATYNYLSNGLLGSSNSSSCSGTSTIPGGQCLDLFTPSGLWPGGSWSNLNPNGDGQWGGAMVTIDPGQGFGFMVLDSSGNAWVDAVFNTYEATMTECGTTNAVVLDQVAYNTDSSSYGMFGLGQAGTVWSYMTGATGFTCPLGGAGWVQVGSKTAWAASITTDNDLGSSGARAVWATDSSGDIWYAN